jgi:hypothetical protein
MNKSRKHTGHIHHPREHDWAMSLKHDAWFCITCDVWLEPPCGCGPEDDCPFPAVRPDKPSDAGGQKLLDGKTPMGLA